MLFLDLLLSIAASNHCWLTIMLHLATTHQGVWALPLENFEFLLPVDLSGLRGWSKSEGTSRSGGGSAIHRSKAPLIMDVDLSVLRSPVHQSLSSIVLGSRSSRWSDSQNALPVIPQYYQAAPLKPRIKNTYTSTVGVRSEPVHGAAMVDFSLGDDRIPVILSDYVGEHQPKDALWDFWQERMHQDPKGSDMDTNINELLTGYESQKQSQESPYKHGRTQFPDSWSNEGDHSQSVEFEDTEGDYNWYDSQEGNDFNSLENAISPLIKKDSKEVIADKKKRHVFVSESWKPGGGHVGHFVPREDKLQSSASKQRSSSKKTRDLSETAKSSPWSEELVRGPELPYATVVFGTNGWRPGGKRKRITKNVSHSKMDRRLKTKKHLFLSKGWGPAGKSYATETPSDQELEDGNTTWGDQLRSEKLVQNPQFSSEMVWRQKGLQPWRIPYLFGHYLR